MSEQMPDEMEMLQMAHEEIATAHALFDAATIEHSGQTLVDRIRLLIADRDSIREVAKQKVIRNRKLEAVVEAAEEHSLWNDDETLKELRKTLVDLEDGK